MVAVAGLDLQALQNHILKAGGQLDPPGAGRDQLVLVHTLQGLGGQIARDRRVEARRQRVDVRIGPLLSPADILLFRRVARLEHHVQALALVAQAIPGGAEIQQLDAAVRRQDDVVRRHVPVDDTLFMNGAQGVHHRCQDPDGLLPGDLAALVLDVSLEALSLYVVHHEIGGAVLLKVAPHADDIGVSLELCQHPGLVQESLHAVAEVLLPLPGVDGYLMVARGPDGHAVRQELLDGDLDIQLVVPGQIGDAEAALAQDAACDELTG